MFRARGGMGWAVAVFLGVLFVHLGDAGAACTWQNGRPRCDLGGLRFLLGEPWGLVGGAPGGDLVTAPLASAPTDLPGARGRPRLLYEVSVQRFSYDPRACRPIGQEMYCQ